jgi:hypothetical protein
MILAKAGAGIRFNEHMEGEILPTAPAAGKRKSHRDGMVAPLHPAGVFNR